MKQKTSLFLVLMLLFCVQTFAQNTKKYKTYHNERFDFCLQYPKGFKAGIAPANGDGLSFHSKKNDSHISAYGALQMPEETLKSFFEAEEDDINITYTALVEKKNYFVISGLIPEKAGIFYRKTVLKDGVFLTLIYNYPQEHADYFKQVIEETAANFPACE